MLLWNSVLLHFESPSLTLYFSKLTKLFFALFTSQRYSVENWEFYPGYVFRWINDVLNFWQGWESFLAVNFFFTYSDHRSNEMCLCNSVDGDVLDDWSSPFTNNLHDSCCKFIVFNFKNVRSSTSHKKKLQDFWYNLFSLKLRNPRYLIA